MKIITVLEAALNLMKNTKSGTKLKTNTGTVSREDAILALEKLLGWCFPSLNSDQFEKVIHCRDCQNYKKFHKTEGLKKQYKMLCSLDKAAREPEFYCAAAKEKENPYDDER